MERKSSYLQGLTGLLLIALFTPLLVSCVSAVRSNIFPHKQEEKVRQAPPLRPPELVGISTVKNKPNDTTVIDYTAEPARPQPKESESPVDFGGREQVSAYKLEADFEKALKKFDNEQFEEACAYFDIMSGVLPERDSLRFEALFMKAECALINDRVPEANRILNSLYLNSDIPDVVLERAMLRLGQSYCILGNKARAEEIFADFAVIFPVSFFLPLANCAEAGR